MTHAWFRHLVAVAVLGATFPAAAQPSPGGPPSLVGTWSGVSRGGAAEVPQAESFDADGTFVSVGRLPDGFTLRVWGTYGTEPAGPDRLRVRFQVRGWAPRQLCDEGSRPAPECRPFDLPVMTDTVLVTFPSPDRLLGTSEIRPGVTTAEARDDHPALLRAAVPERWTYCRPTVPGACGTGRPDLARPRACDDVQQRRICIVSGGHLVQPRTGCLACVPD